MTMSGKTVLVVGGDSRIGRSLIRRLRQSGARVLTTSRRPAGGDPDCSPLDLERDLRGWSPPRAVDAAVLCAAVTSQKRCRDDPAGTYSVNVRGTIELAASLLAGGAFVVFPSTNLVFDGSAPFRSEPDPVAPGGDYGRQKSEAERRLQDLNPDRVAILRFTKILGPGLDPFEGWLRRLRAGDPIHPFEDMVLAPLPLGFATEALFRVTEAQRAGLWHVSADRDLSYADAARHLVSRLSLDPALVQPVLSRSGGVDPGSIPRHTVLDAGRLQREFGLQPPPAASALEELLAP